MCHQSRTAEWRPAMENQITSLTKTSLQKNIDNSRIFLVIYILKQLSSEEHMVTPSELCSYLTILTGSFFHDDYSRTIKRELLSLCETMEFFEANKPEISNSIRSILGGRIIHVIPKKTHHFFYFQPDTDESDMALLSGSIVSNRHLAKDEKNYLLSRLSTLNSFLGMENINPEISQQIISTPTFVTKPIMQNHDLLTNVQVIYEAIDEQLQIEIIYGYYTTTSSSQRKIEFISKNKNGAYLLNPYALLWNAGQYYLIATFNGKTNPIHFRVDRIIKAAKAKDPDDLRIYKKRDSIPASLKPYYAITSKNCFDFLSEKYTADFPLMMGIFDENEFVDALIECTTNSLSILIDTFGTNITVVPSTIDHGNITDYNGKPLSFIIARINHVQYNNLLLFCLEQQATVTDEVSPLFALYPPKLVSDIQFHLENSFHRYKEYSNNAHNIPHPFVNNKTLGSD